MSHPYCKRGHYMSEVTIYMLIYLVPLVPACVFYGGRKGSRAKFEGKLAGFAVDLGGGIAAYAAVFLLGIYFVAPHFYLPTARTIHIRGTLQFAAARPKPADVLVAMYPPELSVPEGMSFDWPVTLVDDTEHIVVHPTGY